MNSIKPKYKYSLDTQQKTEQSRVHAFEESSKMNQHERSFKYNRFR